MVAAAFFELLADGVVPLGVKMTETQVLELQGPGAHPQPIRNRCKDIEGLGGNPLAFFGLERPQRTHIVESIGEFDQDDADVLSHCQQHLAKILRFGMFA